MDCLCHWGREKGSGGEGKTQIQARVLVYCIGHALCWEVPFLAQGNRACPLFPSETPPKAGLDLEACLKWETLNYLANWFYLYADEQRQWEDEVPSPALFCWLSWWVGGLIYDQVLSFVWFWWAAGSTRDSKSVFHQHLLHHGTKAWKTRCLRVPKASFGKTK